MEHVKPSEKKEIDWKKVHGRRDLDNLVNLAKKTPENLLDVWKKKYQIEEKDLTTKFIRDPKDKELGQKEAKSMMKEIFKRRNQGVKKRNAVISGFKEQPN